MGKITDKKDYKSAYHLALKHIKTLNNDFLIKEKEQIKSKHGKPSKIYEITTLGIVTFLSQEHEDNIIVKVIKKHDEHLPLVFKKWGFFEKEGINEQILNNLKKASKYFISNDVWVIRMQNVERTQSVLKNLEKQKIENSLANIFPNGSDFKKDIKDFWKTYRKIMSGPEKIFNDLDDLINAIFGLSVIFQSGVGNDLMVILQILRKDAEIKQYISKQMCRMVNDHTLYLKRTKEWCSWWGSLP